MNEHDGEPVRGLPERLPEGERILWQGAPAWHVLARRAFHLPALAVYFGALVAWRALDVLASGGNFAQAAFAAATLLPLALAAAAILAGLAYAVGRTSLYTITNRRIVMRIGIVLSITFNLPFRAIEGVGLHVNADGSGDLPLSLAAGDRIAYLHLWPHARPWRVSRPEPMLRAVPDAARVAGILREALVAALPEGAGAMTTASTDAPERLPSREPLPVA